ncbi:MAG: glycosyltransferase 61 family protein [Burkholderiaceae bacterium]
MFSVRPITSRLFRQSLDAIASEIHVVHPPQRTVRRAAVFLPDAIDRIKGVQEETHLAYEMDRVNGGQVEHAATIAYRLDDVHLVEGRLLMRRGHVKLVHDERRLIGPRHIGQQIECAAFTSSIVSDRYFGHALIDRSATSLLASEFAPVRHPQWQGTTPSPHLAWYEQLWGVNAPLLDDAAIGQAWVFQDFGMNAHRARRMQHMRQRIHTLRPQQPAPMALILRGSNGARRHLANEQALADLLAARGACIVDPMRESAENIARMLAGVPLVIGVEGSALAHGLVAIADRGAMLIIQPPYRFNNLFKDYADALGLLYGFVVADGSQDSFELDPGRLLRAIDLVQEELARPSGQVSDEPVPLLDRPV